MNVFHIINNAFYQRAKEVFNPRCAMYISRNDGRFNNAVNIEKDTVICANTLMRLGRKYYTDAEMNKIRMLRSQRK